MIIFYEGKINKKANNNKTKKFDQLQNKKFL